MEEPEFLTVEQMLVRVMMVEIWMLASGVYSRKQVVKGLERLGAAAYLLKTSLIQNGERSERGESPPIYLVIEAELEELRRG